MLRIRWLLFTEKLTEAWGKLSPRGRKRIRRCGILLLLLLAIFAFWQHFQRGMSEKELLSVYHKNEAAFQTAREVLLSMPEQEETYDLYWLNVTYINRTREESNPEKVIEKQYGELWIYSPIEYSEEEYQRIHDAAAPLFRKTKIDRISITPQKNFICFEFFDSVVLCCIFYDEMSISVAVEEYIDDFKNHNLNHPQQDLAYYTDYADVTYIRQMDAGWFIARTVTD